ncbi:MAG: hypothetical protein AAGA56_09030, partial [Myxococcota bacterium]
RLQRELAEREEELGELFICAGVATVGHPVRLPEARPTRGPTSSPRMAATSSPPVVSATLGLDDE